MRYPALNDLIKKADNKYSLVNATAKRAREIVEGDEPLVKIKIDNPVTIATNEIAEDMVGFIHKELSEDDKDDQEPVLTETDEENQTPEE